MSCDMPLFFWYEAIDQRVGQSMGNVRVAELIYFSKKMIVSLAYVHFFL